MYSKLRNKVGQSHQIFFLNWSILFVVALCEFIIKIRQSINWHYLMHAMLRSMNLGGPNPFGVETGLFVLTKTVLLLIILLILWRLTWPCYQQPRLSLRNMCRYLSFTRNHVNYRSHISVLNFKHIWLFPEINSACKSIKSKQIN